MHPILAIRAFFTVLFGGRVAKTPKSASALPAGDDSERMADLERDLAEAKARIEALQENQASRPETPPPEAVAVTTLSILQAEGRFLDFLSEEIADYSDEEIGAAVREVHRDCKKAMETHFKLVPVRGEEEGAMMTVPNGYDPGEIRLVGNVVGNPPFSGTVKHRGWRASEVRLPRIDCTNNGLVVMPAEVEI